MWMFFSDCCLWISNLNDVMNEYFQLNNIRDNYLKTRSCYRNEDAVIKPSDVIFPLLLFVTPFILVPLFLIPYDLYNRADSSGNDLPEMFGQVETFDQNERNHDRWPKHMANRRRRRIRALYRSSLGKSRPRFQELPKV